jgi:hypothetical protein
MSGSAPHRHFDASCQNVAVLLTTDGNTPLPTVVRFAQNPIVELVAPGAITRFQLSGEAVTTPLLPEKVPFQFV